MKKDIFICLLFLITISVVKAQDEDVVLPNTPGFQKGTSIEGVVASSINETTGKVLFSTPLTSIGTGGLSYAVSLTYNGAAALLTAKNTNEYSPVSSVGVGFAMSVPKIIADYKGTKTRQDDTYYLNMGNPIKLICTSGSESDLYVYYETESLTNWKVINLASIHLYFSGCIFDAFMFKIFGNS